MRKWWTRPSKARMPNYQYKVKKGPGGGRTGVLEAESQRAAVARLRDMGYFPISVEEYAGEVKEQAAQQVRKALNRITLKERNLFFRQFANLSEAGMMITKALRTLSAHPDQIQN